MSVFKVSLNNFNNGPNDVAAFGVRGAVTARTFYAPGPHLVNRILKDGETFTDCNYWKQFAYPNLPLNEAFITVLEDDGSTWDLSGSEASVPRVYDIAAAAGTTYEDNQAAILSDTGATAGFAQITNTGSGDVKVRLNGQATAILDLPNGTSQVFNAGDLSLSLIEIDNSASGASNATVQILVSVKSGCKS